MKTKFIIINSSIVTALILIVFIFMLWLGPGGKQDKVVVIPPQSRVVHISQQLKKADVIHSKLIFRIVLKVSGQDRRLKAGEYRFSPFLPITSVIAKMVKGDVVRHAVTIPEGFTATQIARTLEAKGLAKQEEFMAVVNDSALAEQLSVPAHSLEGFLFPNTYQFSKGMTAAQIAKRMVKQFFDQVNPLLAAKEGYEKEDLFDLVIMASIIEREVRVDKERPLVASVFYNRISQNKRLESCATILYSQGRFSGAVTHEDLYFKSPYNTYRRRGLPPGPISNPGFESLKAAAFPADTKFLFFVVRADGEHVFSEDFEAHKLAKWRSQKAKRKAKQPTQEKQP